MADLQDIDGWKEASPPKPKTAAPEGSFTFRAQHVSYEGSIPPPGMLAQYGEVLPDAPERIIAMVERQEAHRHRLESTVVEAGAKNATIGVLVTAYIATLFTGLSAFMVYEHYIAWGIATAGSTLASLVGANIYGKVSQKNERAQKDKLLRESDESRQARRRLAQPQSKQNADEQDISDDSAE